MQEGFKALIRKVQVAASNIEFAIKELAQSNKLAFNVVAVECCIATTGDEEYMVFMDAKPSLSEQALIKDRLAFLCYPVDRIHFRQCQAKPFIEAA